jgi:hypothetical protein
MFTKQRLLFIINGVDDIIVIPDNEHHILSEDSQLLFSLEKSLFSEHLDILDRTIAPGIGKYNWGSQADTFVYACRKECQEVFSNVQKFQNNVMKINQEFEKISTSVLTNVQKKLYLLSEFIG